VAKVTWRTKNRDTKYDAVMADGNGGEDARRSTLVLTEAVRVSRAASSHSGGTMPFVQIHTSRAVSPATRRALGGTLARAYAEHMQTDSRIVNVGFVHYAEGEPARYDGTDEAPREMVIVTADVRAGREAAHQAAIGRAFTTACAQALGVAEERVAVYLTEHASHQIYRDGGTAPAWSPAEAAKP